MRAFSKLLLTFLLLFCVNQAFATSFTVSSIRVEGLQGISPQTVISYMPVKSGQRFDTSQSGAVINDIYASGFFSDVRLAQEGNVLVVRVVERPVISDVVVTGNKAIQKDKINSVLKEAGIAQGRVFNSAVLERVKSSLQSEYDAMGKYTATVTTNVASRSHNRVLVRIDISEGLYVKVADIKIIGNEAFSSRRLMLEMPMTTFRLWSFLTSSDDYNQEKLDASLEALRDFYQDHGYLKFKIDSAQASLTPDRKSVYVIIRVTEGPVYKVSGYKFAGRLIVPESDLRSVVTVKVGQSFSKKDVRASVEAISQLLGNLGYAFASVNPVPNIDDENRVVDITFYIDPGVRVYVRRVNFDGNVKTKDIVLRRYVRQMEGGVVNIDDIKESERQLNVTGFAESVNIETAPVADTPDEIDLNYHIKEAPSAQATLGAGYGTDGLQITAGVNQNNFLGTGTSLGINFNSNQVSTLYSINYNDPYYTLDGISQGFNLFYQKTNPGNLNGASYRFNVWGGSLSYSLPMSAKGDAVQFSLGYQSLELFMGGLVGQQELNFVAANGNHFSQFLLNASWTRNGLDKAIFPTKGLYQDAGLQLFAPAGGHSLKYYKANYDGQFYYPITNNGFVATGRISLGYGDGLGSTTGLPFFANFYAGGPGFANQVRGYSPNTLGPKDTPQILTGNGGTNPLGGNILTTGTLALIFPNPASSDKLRTSVFMDAGNVYSRLPAYLGGTPSGPVRYSTGLAADWRVPVFNVVLNLAVAKALNAQPGDQLQAFSFNIGTNF